MTEPTRNCSGCKKDFPRHEYGVFKTCEACRESSVKRTRFKHLHPDELLGNSIRFLHMMRRPMNEINL